MKEGVKWRWTYGVVMRSGGVRGEDDGESGEEEEREHGGHEDAVCE